MYISLTAFFIFHCLYACVCGKRESSLFELSVPFCSLSLPLLFDLTSKYVMPGHTNMGNLASLPWKLIFQLPESLERRWKAHYFFIHGLLIWLISLSYSFDLRQKRSHTKKGSFMQCITGGPPMDSSLSMNEGGSMRKAGFLYEDSNKKKKGQTISYWIIRLNEEELFMWSHFTTIWNARNFDWWKPVHEDAPFSYVQFPSFGKHPVSQ